MPITDLFIRRPILATVLSLLILLIGIKSFFLLPVRQFPEIDSSVISITTSYSGASAELMEGFVTTPIENAVASIEGIDYLTSSSSQGNSNITLNLQLGYDINKAITDTTSKISSVRYLLPNEINDPVVSKQDPNARPTMYLSFSSNLLSPEEITDYLIRVLSPQIQTLPGVGSAAIYGKRLYAMRIWLDPLQMAAHNITATDVQQSLEQSNLQTAGGRIIGQSQEYNIKAQTDLQNASEFNELVLKNQDNYPLRLKDIGYATLGPADDRSSINTNGKQAVIMGIIPQSTANPLDISREVNELLPKLAKGMPKGLQVAINWDTSKFIRASLKEVYLTIFAATACVVTVIFLFLGSIRAILIPIVTIPLSLIGVCSLMLVMGYTINTLTLLAWVLAIGLVVDDGIVVLENIHRHMQDGMSALEAALLGAREIRFAIITITFTLAAVYAPIGFISGLTGSLFREFAFTLASAVIISGIIALTLSPMMCSHLLVMHQRKIGLSEKIDSLFQKLMQSYHALLKLTFKHKTIVIAATVIIYLSCFFMYRGIPNELAPAEDQGAILSLITAPTTANLAYTEKYTQELAQIFTGIDEQITFGIINGSDGAVNSGFAYLVLKPWDERKRSADEIIQSLLPQLWAIPGITAFPVNLPSLPGTSEFTPVSFVLKTTGSYSDLYAATTKMLAIAQANPALVNIDSDLKLNKSQLNITIDRNKASALGIPIKDISSTLNLLLGEPTVTRFIMYGRSYDVIPQLLPQFIQSDQQLGTIQLRAANNLLVPLANIIALKHQTIPDSLNHFQQQRAAKISASLAPGYTLGQALKYLQQAANQTLPDTIQTDYSGQSRQLIQASDAMLQTFGFALLFIFLILAAQFESFRDPLIVMLSVPFSLAGALLAMHLTDCTLNIYTQIGLVTLIGLISKHGILIVEFANQLQTQGQDKLQAVLQAASLRLRPILMTTAAMALGALPLALASGAGAVSRSQIGWVIIGGIAIGTLFTVLVVPMAYTLLAKQHKPK